MSEAYFAACNELEHAIALMQEDYTSDESYLVFRAAIDKFTAQMELLLMEELL